jgi:hypothetical protein
MRIFSHFRDYYDYVQSYGSEKTIVYNRKGTNFFEGTPELKEFSIIDYSMFGTNYHYISLIGFCGRIIPKLKYYDRVNKKDVILFGDDAKEHIYKINAVYSLNNLIRFFQDDSQQKLFAPLFKKYNIPIFSVISNSTLTFNPCLKELGIDTIMSAEQVFQDISCFIGNELKEQMVMTKQDNKGKIVSHGFDLKTSFRPKMKAQ